MRAQDDRPRFEDVVGRGVVAFATLVALAAGCGGGSGAAMDAGADSAPTDSAPPMDSAPPIPPPDVMGLSTYSAGNAVDATDARFEGQQRFLWDAWGTEVLGDWPPADFMLDLMTSEPDVFGDQYSAFGFLPDPDDDFPVGFKRGLEDPTQVHETCALCHVGRLDGGGTWFGAPNRRLDLGSFKREVNARWVAAGNPALFTDLVLDKATGLGPGRTGAESGAFPQLVPADFPVYYTLAERTHLNYLGTGGDVRTEAHFGIFTFGAGAPNAREAVVPFPDSLRFDPFLDFLGTMAPPAAPTGDATLIAAGLAVFETARCGECHHPHDIGLDQVVTLDREPDGLERHPGDDDAFPNGSIRTSITHRLLQDDPAAGTGGDDGFADLIQFILRRRLMVSMTDGYRTADLRGIWTSAPYLHNGSVPTLEDLLTPAAERPTTFMRGELLIDTSVEGNGNEGHEFGTDLSDEDKAALLAYLRSL